MKWLFIAAILMAIGGCAQESEPFLRVPERGDVLKTLRAGHPRLLVLPATFERLKTAIRSDELLAEWHKDVLAQANGLLSQPPSKYEIPDGLRLLATSRRVRDRILTLGYAYRMTGERKYAARAWTELEAAAGFKDWNPRHFLDTGEMTCAFGIGYDWLYDAWTPDQRGTLRDAVVKLGLTPALRSYRGQESYGWWVRADHNWNQVCNGGLAIGALAVAEEEPEVAAEVLHSGLESLPRAMRSFAPDGGWGEGPGYWNYATAYNVLHLSALETALDDDFGFSRFPGFDRTGDFPVYLTGTSGLSFNYADGGAGPIRAPQMFWLARRFRRPDYARYERKVGRASALDLIWAVDAPTGEADKPVLDRNFEGIGVVTMRSAWGDPNALFVGFKAGSNRVNHSHLDLGSFVVDALGERWVTDLGSDDYNMPGYFGGQRWTYYRLRAEGHNTLVLDPGTGPDQEPSAAARIVRFESGPQRAFAIADLAPAYKGKVEKALRGIALTTGRTAVVVQDEIAPADETDIWWFLHTSAKVELYEAGRSAVLSIGEKRFWVRLVEPGDGRFEVMNARPLPSSPNPKEQNANEGIRKLALHLRESGSVRIVVILQPLGKGEPPSPMVAPLDDW